MSDFSTRRPLRPLHLQVLSPCRENWADMPGGDRERFCQRCQRPVFDLSAMTTAQAEAVLADHNGSPCVRFAMGSDGRVLTTDARHWSGRVALALAASLWTGASTARASPDAAVPIAQREGDAACQTAAQPGAEEPRGDAGASTADQLEANACRASSPVMGRTLRVPLPDELPPPPGDRLTPADERTRADAMKREARGREELAQGRPASALRFFRQALALRSALVGRRPDAITTHRELFQSHEQVAQLLQQTEPSAARDAYRAALTELTWLVAHDTHSRMWNMRALVICLHLRQIARRLAE